MACDTATPALLDAIWCRQVYGCLRTRLRAGAGCWAASRWAALLAPACPAVVSVPAHALPSFTEVAWHVPAMRMRLHSPALDALLS